MSIEILEFFKNIFKNRFIYMLVKLHYK